MLTKLDAYIAAADPSNLSPNLADTLAARSGQVTNLSVRGEVLSTASALRRATELPSLQHGDYFHPFDLHSQALPSAFVHIESVAVRAYSTVAEVRFDTKVQVANSPNWRAAA